MTDSTDVLLKAADLLGEKGWMQGDEIDSLGRMCALGAIRAAARELTGLTGLCLSTATNREVREAIVVLSGLREGALSRLAVHISRDLTAEESRHWYGGVPGWNDEPERTAEDVILALKKAANND